MHNVTNDFTPKDTAQMLGLNSETLRKYALALESSGYLFSKTDGGHRKYYQQDVTALTQFKTLLNQNGMTIELAAQIIATKHSAPPQTVTTAVTVPQNYELERFDERYKDIMAKMELIEQLPVLMKKLQEAEQRDQEKARILEELQNRVGKQGEVLVRIENSVTQFSVSDLAKELRKIQQAEVAAAVQQEDKPKRGFFARLFGKKS